MTIPDELALQIESAAKARDASIDELVTELLSHRVDELAGLQQKRQLSFIGIGKSKAGITHQIDDLLADGSVRSNGHASEASRRLVAA